MDCTGPPYGVSSSHFVLSFRFLSFPCHTPPLSPPPAHHITSPQPCRRRRRRRPTSVVVVVARWLPEGSPTGRRLRIFLTTRETSPSSPSLLPLLHLHLYPVFHERRPPGSSPLSHSFFLSHSHSRLVMGPVAASAACHLDADAAQLGLFGEKERGRETETGGSGEARRGGNRIG